MSHEVRTEFFTRDIMLAPQVSDPSVFRIWFGVCSAGIVKELCKGGRLRPWRNCNDSKSVTNS